MKYGFKCEFDITIFTVYIDVSEYILKGRKPIRNIKLGWFRGSMLNYQVDGSSSALSSLLPRIRRASVCPC